MESLHIAPHRNYLHEIFNSQNSIKQITVITENYQIVYSILAHQIVRLLRIERKKRRKKRWWVR